jgi:diacylglycerol kinase (ATP)
MNRTSEEELRDLMRRHGLGEELVAASSSEEAERFADEAVEAGYDVIVAAGGDGTAGTVARRLLHKPTALGILPLGSAMNIARSLGIPRDLDAAARVIAAGVVRSIDTGIAQTGHAGQVDFFEAGSVGLTAALFEEGQRIDRGEYLGLLDLIRVFARFRPHRMTIHLDEETLETRALMLAVANGPYTGLGFTIAPDARLDDGLFDVRIARRFKRPEALFYMLAIAFGRRSYQPKVTTHRASRVVVESRHPVPCRADANDLGTTPATFVVRPSSLRVIVPAPGQVDPEEASPPALQGVV